MLAFPSVAPVRWGSVKTGKANHMVLELLLTTHLSIMKHR